MNVVAIVGPTASGKSDLAYRLAVDTGACVVSADSMQVYRGMDIGTAKPSPAERSAVNHFLIDLVEPEEPFSAADFQMAGRAVLAANPERLVVVVGGSGLHVRALLDPMTFAPHDPERRASINRLPTPEAVAQLLSADPEAGDVVDLANPRRVQRALEIVQLTGQTPTTRAATPEARALADYEPYVPFVGFGVDPADALERRVRQRLAAMVAAGFVDEVRGLKSRLGRTAAGATGYGEFIRHIDGEYSLSEAVDATVQATLSLAKRQRTFFRRDPRIVWLEWREDPKERYRRFRAELDRLIS